MYASNILYRMLSQMSGETIDIGDVRVKSVEVKETFSDEIKRLLRPYRRNLVMRG